jgi:hypothetical protein
MYIRKYKRLFFFKLLKSRRLPHIIMTAFSCDMIDPNEINSNKLLVSGRVMCTCFVRAVCTYFVRAMCTCFVRTMCTCFVSAMRTCFVIVEGKY